MEEPPPPPVVPPPPDRTPASTAVGNANLYTILSWVLFPPLGSFLFMFIAGKQDPEARFNAANATAVHGLMLAVSFVLWVLTQGIGVFVVLLWIWNAIWFFVWAFGVVLAAQSQGQRFRYPVLTDTLAGVIPALENLAQ